MPTSYTYDDADQMLTAATAAYGYDANGNQVSRDSDTFSWDAENRLTATNVGGLAGAYAYNGDGLRMSRAIGGNAVSYVWDQASSLPQVLQDSGGNRYVYGLDLITRIDPNGAPDYYLTDGLGSTTGLADATGTVTDSYGYDVFGAIRAQTGTSDQEFMFAGEQTDPVGFEYLRARYYDAVSGRFASRDHVEFTQPYTYAGGNPVNLVDPYGLLSCRRCRKLAHAVTDAIANANDVGVAASVKLDDALNSIPGTDSSAARAFDYVARTAGNTEADALGSIAAVTHYCVSSQHLLECGDRLEIAAVGVAVTGFGATIGLAACGIAGPLAGAVTFGAGDVAICGLGIVPAAIVTYGGLSMFCKAFATWHERDNSSVGGVDLANQYCGKE